MTGPQRLLTLWVWLLLAAALFPAAPYAHAKRGSPFKAGKKGDGNKEPSSAGRGLSKQGLKWAGAAAAGVLGGTGTGYGLGFLGRPKHRSKDHRGHKASHQEQRVYYHEVHGAHNRSHRRAFGNTAAPGPLGNVFLALGHVVPFLVALWIKAI